MSNKQNPIHALLAVEPDLKNVATKILNETMNTFAKKSEHFDGIRKSYVSEDDSATGTNNTELKEVVTTVAEKIAYSSPAIAAGINAQLSKEQTNSSGTVEAELAVGDTNFGKLSATALLTLEKEMVKIRKMYELIPTLDPAKTWSMDEVSGKWKTPETTTFRTGKKEDWITVSPATKEHPAQVKLVTKDVPVGKYLTSYMSGKITPTNKSKLLDRVDSLILAVKRARSLANQAEVVKCNVGSQIFEYINEGILK
jgi:hypothetical protein